MVIIEEIDEASKSIKRKAYTYGSKHIREGTNKRVMTRSSCTRPVSKLVFENWKNRVRAIKRSQEYNLFPGFPPEREKTITSAPSLMVLVLNPFPSIQNTK